MSATYWHQGDLSPSAPISLSQRSACTVYRCMSGFGHMPNPGKGTTHSLPAGFMRRFRTIVLLLLLAALLLGGHSAATPLELQPLQATWDLPFVAALHPPQRSRRSRTTRSQTLKLRRDASKRALVHSLRLLLPAGSQRCRRSNLWGHSSMSTFPVAGQSCLTSVDR